MPANYAELTEEEMTYVEGGFSWRLFVGFGSLIVGAILGIAGGICNSCGNTSAGNTLSIIAQIFSAVGGVVLGLPIK